MLRFLSHLHNIVILISYFPFVLRGGFKNFICYLPISLRKTERLSGFGRSVNEVLRSWDFTQREMLVRYMPSVYAADTNQQTTLPYTSRTAKIWILLSVPILFFKTTDHWVRLLADTTDILCLLSFNDHSINHSHLPVPYWYHSYGRLDMRADLTLV